MVQGDGTMSLPLCPKHKVPLLPEGASLLRCPDCDHTIVRLKSNSTEERRQEVVVRKSGYQDGRRKKP